MPLCPLQVCTLLLSLLFTYDIFWVFGSPYLWTRNVMVEAATKQVRSARVKANTQLSSSPLPSHPLSPPK